MLARTLALVAVSLALHAADPALENANAKLDRISNNEAKPGEVILFTPAEINAWAKDEVPMAVPQGIRDPRVELGNSTATGSAIVNLLKMEQARGKSFGIIMTKMLEGERPLKVSVRLSSSGGKCTVYLTSVELGSITVEGTLLDLLIKNFFLPLYPDAKIGQPFDLADNVERLEVRPDGVRVVIKR